MDVTNQGVVPPRAPDKALRVAIVHYWFVGMRGGEKVVEALLDIFPQADIYCHVFDRSAVSKKIADRFKGITFINRLPWARKKYQSYLPLMPMALEGLDLRDYDLVISSESGPAKGIIVAPEATHVCYCHSPMRYVWDMYHDYRETAGLLTRWLMPPVMHYLRIWDVTTAARVDHFICNSRYVASRVRRYYHRESSVVHPPVAVEDFAISEEIGDYYLFVGQLVDYKRADLAVAAFNENGRPLKVVGDGMQMKRLKSLARPNVELVGKVDPATLKDLYSHAKALIFPGIEDFGIVPLEAMASGRPVIAFARGGALETVVEGKTGVLFYEQTPRALNEAVARFERFPDSFDPVSLREHARLFDHACFRRHMTELIGRISEDGKVESAR